MITPEQFKEIEELLERVESLPASARPAYLDEHCDDPVVRERIEILLESGEEKPSLLVDDLGARSVATPSDLTGGKEIGPYRLLDKLGEGGMGEVWLAEQTEPVRRKVALKVIKHGMDTKRVVARFEAERQALALMEHPSVATVYDAGSTKEGRPYFVMEYVSGVPITEHCDRRRLTTRERLELFCRVCEGVQHAHQKAIIHRDLKPSNVLVADRERTSVPKIIDFGVAKATAQQLTEKTLHTELGMLIGTPEYMSPEQADRTGRNIDTRTDVYSLGVILYELLTGALPFEPRELRESGYDVVLRKIREEEPAKPSTRVGTLDGERSTLAAERRRVDVSALRRQLLGDLDWITMRALEKDRARRYGSPAELAADIERHLKDEPVLAGPPSAGYRARKLVRRHRVGVLAAGLVLLSLLLGVAGTSVGLLRALRAEADAVAAAESARAAEENATLEARTARRVSDFLVQLFRVSDPGEARGNSITAREILDRGAERIRNDLDEEPAVQARLMRTMGIVYDNLGLYDPARSLFEDAAEVWRTEEGPDHPEVARNVNSLGLVLRHLGDLEGSRRAHEEALAILEKAHGPKHPEVARSLIGLGNLLLRIDDNEGAKQAYMNAATIFEKSEGPEYLHRASALLGLGIALKELEEYEQADEIQREVLRIYEANLGPDHPSIANALNSHGNLLVRMGRHEEARSRYQRALEIYEKTLGPDHSSVGRLLNNYAILLSDLRESERAREMYLRALEIKRASLGENHIDVASSMENLATLHFELGDVEGARPYIDDAERIYGGALGADHPRLAPIHEQRAILFAAMGDQQTALELASRAQRLTEEDAGVFYSELLGKLRRFADASRSAGRLQHAEQLDLAAARIEGLAGEPDEH